MIILLLFSVGMENNLPRGGGVMVRPWELNGMSLSLITVQSKCYGFVLLLIL